MRFASRADTNVACTVAFPSGVVATSSTRIIGWSQFAAVAMLTSRPSCVPLRAWLSSAFQTPSSTIAYACSPADASIEATRQPSSRARGSMPGRFQSLKSPTISTCASLLAGLCQMVTPQVRSGSVEVDVDSDDEEHAAEAPRTTSASSAASRTTRYV